MEGFLQVVVCLIVTCRMVSSTVDISTLVSSVDRQASTIGSKIDNLGSTVARSVDKIAQNCQDGGVIQNAVHSALDLQTKVNELESLVLSLQKKLEEFGNKSEGPMRSASSVYFSALMSSKLSCYNCNIRYDKVLTNEGNGLNSRTGLFTAPQPGSYYFQFQGLVESGHEARVQMIHNNQIVAHMYDKDAGGGNNNRYAMFGQAVILQMKAGDTFRVVLHKGAVGVQDGLHFNSFVGHIVAQQQP